MIDLIVLFQTMTEETTQEVRMEVQVEQPVQEDMVDANLTSPTETKPLTHVQVSALLTLIGEIVGLGGLYMLEGNSMKCVPSVTFYLMKNSFSDISRKCI